MMLERQVYFTNKCVRQINVHNMMLERQVYFTNKCT